MTKPTAQSDFVYAEWPTGLPDGFDFSECVLDGVPVEDASILQEGPGGAIHACILDFDERLWKSDPCRSLEEAQRVLRLKLGIALG